MMTTPAMRASSDLYCARIWPTSVEIAPKVMKTMLKPMMNAAKLSITLRKSCPSCSFSCSTPTPEIRETYPGTSGSTQGDRNEINPATKAASGNGKLVISVYCSDGAGFAPCLQMPQKRELLQYFRLYIGRSHRMVVIATRAAVAALRRAAGWAGWQARLEPRYRAEFPSTPS